MRLNGIEANNLTVTPFLILGADFVLLSIMGKETQLLEAASAGNNSKVEQLLKGQSKLQKLLSSDKLSDGLSDSPPPLVIQNKKQSSSINVDYRDDTGSTALMLAVLHGHKDVVYTLLQYSAELFTMDNQGNTALHFAAWHNRSDIVDLLLANGALAEIANREGNTPLHYACQYCPPGKTFTINKLLQHNCNVLVTNMAGDSPFDLAVRFNKIDAVPLLIDADVRTLKQTKPIIEAAKNGRKEIIEILLEAGMDPNIFDHNKGTFPMHEAIRYFRKNVAQLLLEFGGDPTQQVSNGQTAISIAKQHPEAKRDEFISMFVQQRGKPLRVPKSQQTHDSPKEKVSADLFITYPLLKNKAEWCQPTPDYCSAWTKQHPPTCLLDNDPISYWKIPAAGAYNWVAVDLGSEYTLTGVRIAGWDNPKMILNFMIECSDSLSGSWRHVQKFKAEGVGSEEMCDPSESQDFKGFYETARCWKLIVADNFGDPTTCLSEIQFFGVEKSVLDWFDQMSLQQYLKSFVLRGFNQLSELATLSRMDLMDVVSDPSHQRLLLQEASQLKKKFCQPTNLWWEVPPVVRTSCDKQLPEISVLSNPYVVGDLEILVHGGGRLRGRTVQPLIAKNNGYKSRATFKGLTIEPAGQYVFEVRCVSNPSLLLRTTEKTKVDPPPMDRSEIGQVFDDFDKMLQFDI